MVRRKLTDGTSSYVTGNYNRGAVTREDELLGYIQSGAVAEDNPYTNFMSQAGSRQDYKAWLKSAADYEAKVADELRQNAYDEARLQEQRAYDRQLTAEQREYDSPLSQVQRERAAGLNPDLQGSSGSGGSGSSGTITQQAMPGVHTGQTTTTGELSSPYGTADRIISGLGSAASMISAVSGFAGTAFELVKGIATFGDYLSMSSSAASAAMSNASIASSNAAVASGTVSSRIDEAAASASRAQTAAADERFMLVGRLASGLNGEQTYSDADLSQIIADNGISDDDGSYLRELKRMKDNPEYRKLYDDRIVDSRYSSARRAVESVNYISTIYSLQQRMTLARSNMDAISSEFDNKIAQYYMTDENASILGGIEADSIEVRRRDLSRAMDVYEKTLSFVDDEISKVDKRIDSLTADIKAAKDNFENKVPFSSAASFRDKEADLNHLLVYKLQLQQFQSDNVRDLASIFSRHFSGDYLTRAMRTNPVTGEDTGYISPGSLVGMDKYNVYSAYLFGLPSSSSSADLSANGVSGLFELMRKLITKGK